jgi:hypothetical protein
MTRLEGKQAGVVTEARSAATTAGMMVAGAAVVSDAVTRLTRLEAASIRWSGSACRRRPGAHSLHSFSAIRHMAFAM